eukprot:COSAG02_NODE_642_length_19038_cov_10.020856_11_plen_80_part_00
MVLGRESGHDVIPSQHFCVRMCIVYLCFQYTLRRFLVHVPVPVRVFELTFIENRFNPFDADTKFNWGNWQNSIWARGWA